MNTLKKIVSTILATSMCFAMVGGFNQILSTAETDTQPIKILPVGDSITDGYWEQGSYRKYMYNYLIKNGFNIDMVGDKGTNEQTSDGLTYDGNYCGYSGYAIQHITGTEERQGIYEVLVDGNVLENCNPDIVLLQIGTNDILSAYNDGIIDRLENLVDYILSYMDEDDDTLFVTTIPNFDVSVLNDAGWLWAYGWGVPSDQLTITIQGYIDSYNSQIKELVLKKQSEGNTHIQFADINSVVDYSTDLYDGVHPNEIGYEKMGKYWSEVLTSYFNGESVVTTTSDITTTIETTLDTTITTEDTTTEDTTTSIEITTPPIEETSTEVITTETSHITYPIGDINRDGEVSNIDLLMLKKRILGISELIDWVDKLPLYDINSDNDVNTLDIIELKSIILK